MNWKLDIVRKDYIRGFIAHLKSQSDTLYTDPINNVLIYDESIWEKWAKQFSKPNFREWLYLSSRIPNQGDFESLIKRWLNEYIDEVVWYTPIMEQYMNENKSFIYYNELPEDVMVFYQAFDLEHNIKRIAQQKTTFNLVSKDQKPIDLENSDNEKQEIKQSNDPYANLKRRVN